MEESWRCITGASLTKAAMCFFRSSSRSDSDRPRLGNGGTSSVSPSRSAAWIKAVSCRCVRGGGYILGAADEHVAPIVCFDSAKLRLVFTDTVCKFGFDTFDVNEESSKTRRQKIYLVRYLLLHIT